MMQEKRKRKVILMETSKDELIDNSEIVLEAIDHTKIDDVDVDELTTAPLISAVQQPRGMGKTEETLEKTQDKINLDEIMLEFTKDYNLDSLKYPEIKKNMLRAFGTLKNIIADNNDENNRNSEDN